MFASLLSDEGYFHFDMSGVTITPRRILLPFLLLVMFKYCIHFMLSS